MATRKSRHTTRKIDNPSYLSFFCKKFVDLYIYIIKYLYICVAKNKQLAHIIYGKLPRKEKVMGAEIINAIKSGLGLIKDLAAEFLDGFETLIWVPASTEGGTTVAAHLSSVGVFAFVMLGVSVSFAIVKLILNLLRGNTGA